MPDVLGICCSNRKNGNSDTALRLALQGSSDAGARVTYLRLNDLHLKTCGGCLKCVFKGRCAIDDDINILLEHMIAADGLIVSVPTYFFSSAAIVKIAVDRALALAAQLDRIAGRVRLAATISVAGNPAWNPLGLELSTLLPLSYCFTPVDYLEFYAPGPGEILLSEEKVQSAYALGQNLARSLSTGKVAKRKPEASQCPVCFSRSFSIIGPGRVRCNLCLSEGVLMEDRFTVSVDPGQKTRNFFAPEGRRHHIEDWIIPSRQHFMANQKAIQEAWDRYRKMIWTT